MNSHSSRGSISWSAYAVAATCLILVALPRFNQQDWGPIKSIVGHTEGLQYERASSEPIFIGGDAKQYLQYARFFEGKPHDSLRAPFAYRPFVPFIGALLPVDPLTGMNLVNLTALLLGLLALLSVLSLRGADRGEQLLGGLLFSFSFPTFYYATIGYVDATLLGCLGIGLWTILYDQRWGFLIVLAVGASVRETILLLIPLAVCYDILRGKPKRSVLRRTVLYFIIVVGIVVIIRLLSPVSPTRGWTPNASTFLRNVMRPRTTLSFFLTAGFPGLFVLPILMRWVYRGCSYWRRHPVETILVLGTGLSVVLFGYALVAAYSDGRFLWMMYPFCIPLVVPILRLLRTRFRKWT